MLERRRLAAVSRGVLTIGASLSPMLQQTRWSRKKTAEILGISYKALLYKIKDGGLDKAS